jgi:hypothetical protein
MENNKQKYSIDIGGNKVPIDYEYINAVATIKSKETFEKLVSLSDTLISGVSGMGHADPKQHIINKATYAQ